MVQKLARTAALALLGVFMLTPAAHAHSQLDPTMLGAPLATSAALGVASYYLVFFWPSLRRVRGRTGATRRGRAALMGRRRSRAKISVVR